MIKTAISTLSSMQQVADLIACHKQMWVLYLSTPGALDPFAVDSPVPFLSRDDRTILSVKGWIMLVIDHEPTAMAQFRQVVGDDGPTKTNQYAGPHRVYAYLTGPDGGVTENT